MDPSRWICDEQAGGMLECEGVCMCCNPLPLSYKPAAGKECSKSRSAAASKTQHLGGVDRLISRRLSPNRSGERAKSHSRICPAFTPEPILDRRYSTKISLLKCCDVWADNEWGLKAGLRTWQRTGGGFSADLPPFGGGNSLSETD